MSLVLLKEEPTDVPTPDATRKTLFIRDDTGVPALKDSDGNVTDLVIGGDASGVTYTPADPLNWTDSTDPGNVDDALNDLAARVVAVESDAGITDAADLAYTPSTPADWDGDADPGDAQEAFDQLAERVTDLEEAPPATPDASIVTFTPGNNVHWTDSEDPGNVDDALDDLASRLSGIEEDQYVPESLDDWRLQEDPGRKSDALDQLANRVNVLENIAPVDVQTGSYLVSGGGVVWNGGYDYTVSAAVYFIGGIQYASAQDDISLSAADATFDRIDVIAVNTAGVVVVVEGTPASNPAKPEIDTDTELELSFVFVSAASSEAEVTEEVVYKENAEWTAVSNAGTIVVNSGTTPFEGSVVINATAAVAGNSVTFTDNALNTLGNYNALTLQIRSKAAWASQKRLNLQWRNGSSPIGTAIALRTGVYGLNTSTTGVYQSVSIPMADFVVGTQQADGLLMSVSGGGGSIGFFVDNIILQAGGSSGGGSTSDPAMLFRDTWSAATSYAAQNVVRLNGQAYVCILDNANQSPPNATYWTPLTSDASNVGYTPSHSINWTDSEDPGNVDTALDDLAARLQAVEELTGSSGDEMMSGYIGSPTAKDYKVVVRAAHGGIIQETTTIAESGTGTVTFKINTNALGGTANSASSSEQTRAHSSSNVFAPGDDIVVTPSSLSSLVGLSFTIRYFRTAT